MKKMLLILLSVMLLFTVTACGQVKESQGNNQQQEQKQEENNNQQNNSNDKTNNEENKITEDDDIIIDDEIIDIDDEDNHPNVEGTVTVEEVINCDGCVYAYFSEEGENAKQLGGIISENEYTTDINKIRTAGNKQRHNFFGLVLSGNTISKAYSCILKDNKIYCIQGSIDGTYHTNNIGILNQIFSADQCKTLSDGHNYWCSDGSYNGNSKTSGYTGLHYETSCTIYGSDSNTGKLICH